MNRFIRKLLFLVIFIVAGNYISAQQRKEIAIPDILGYKTLKCDFHLHTIFSDGDVWPTVRVQEAWREGLDAIAITDHIEYRPHSLDVIADHNRPFDIARPLAEAMGIVIIRGAEITRKMPPGHLNALFLKNANLLERDDWWEACTEAKDQGAFIFWNHPGWKAQQPEKTLWWPEHTRLLEAGIMKGIELYNTDEFYPEALQWANEKGLTILANTDMHAPSPYGYGDGTQHRPMTLVFATDKSEEAIKTALRERRTAVYYNDTLIGDRKFLTPIFIGATEVISTNTRLKNQTIKIVRLHNNSDIPFRLKKRQPSVGFSCPNEIILEAHRTVPVSIEGTSDEIAQMASLRMFYEVTNLITLKGEHLPVNIDIPNR